jgi:uncharacterized membrane protein
MRQMDQLFGELLQVATRTIEIAGVLVIVAGIVRAGFNYIRQPSASDAYRKARCTLGRAILLGLELLMAADIINTVTLKPSWDSVMALGGIVLIRTFLSLALEVEIDGRWPWNRSRGHHAGPGSDSSGNG